VIIEGIGAATGEDQQEESEAVHHRGLAMVVDRKEPVGQMEMDGEVGECHRAARHECGGPVNSPAVISTPVTSSIQPA
jgi:hypothetical protein